MATFYIPTNAELQIAEQEFLPRLQANRPIFDILPIENIDDDIIMWEQEDDYTGLMSFRGLNGQPGRVKKVGMNRWIVTPGAYGDQSDVDELSLTRRRTFGTFGTAIDVTDLVSKEQMKLLQRRLDRIEKVGWDLITTGTYSVFDGTGATVKTDTFTTQTFTASVTWAMLATATPLQDLRTMKLLHRGHSVRFDSTSKLYVNQTTINAVMNNTNASDIGGKKNMYGATANLSLKQVNEILLGDELPLLVPMEDGYKDDAGVFQLFLPSYTGALIGKRTSGTPIGSYAMTRNANNPDLGPGPYTKVIDLGENEVPRRIVVHDGFNGGIKLPFPAAIVSCIF